MKIYMKNCGFLKPINLTLFRAILGLLVDNTHPLVK